MSRMQSLSPAQAHSSSPSDPSCLIIQETPSRRSERTPEVTPLEVKAAAKSQHIPSADIHRKQKQNSRSTVPIQKTDLPSRFLSPPQESAHCKTQMGEQKTKHSRKEETTEVPLEEGFSEHSQLWNGPVTPTEF